MRPAGVQHTIQHTIKPLNFKTELDSHSVQLYRKAIQQERKWCVLGNSSGQYIDCFRFQKNARGLPAIYKIFQTKNLNIQLGL
jgi:hypothetical protein